MFAKFSCFLLLAFLFSGQAFPEHEHSSSEEHPHKHNHGKEHKHDHKHDHKHAHQEEYGEGKLEREGLYGGMDAKINPNSPYLKIQNLTGDFYNEFFVLASGDNYLSPEVPSEVHISARAVVLLSQKLHDMAKVYPILADICTEYALKGARVEDKQTIVDFINDVVAHVRNNCSDFETVRNSLTDSFISRGKYFKPGMTPQEKSEANDKWMKEPFMCTASLNRLFYRGTMKGEDKHYYKILRSIVDHAVTHENYREKLEKIYANAIAKTILKACPYSERFKAIGLFYQYLMEQLADDAPLSVMLYGSHKLLLINKPF